MKHLLRVAVTLLLTSLAFADTTEKFQQIRIFVPDKATLDRVWSAGVDYEGVTGKVGASMEFVVGDHELSELQARGISYEVVIDDLAAYYESQLAKEPVNALGFGFGSMGGFYTFAEVIQQLDSMRLLYPSLITVRDSVGTSWENRALWAVKISDNPSVNEPDEPEVLYTALHHAREPQGMMTILYYMWWLLENYGTNTEATYLVNNRQMWFIPVQNPDGYVYNQTTNPNGGGLWRKNRRNNSGSFGVDPNRNYGPMYMWNAPNGGSSTTPSSDTYRGPAPFSEPENQAIDNFMRSHNVKTCFNYHTYGNYLIYPWGYLSTENSDSVVYRWWTYEMTAANHYTNGTDQQTVSYSTRGNSDDYMFGDTTKPSTWTMTPEVGITGFWPTTNLIFPLAIENLPQNKYLSYFAGHFPVSRGPEIQPVGGNSFLDAGEDFSFVFSVRNIGVGTASNLTATVSSDAAFLQFPSPSQLIGILGSQLETQLSFQGSASSTAPISAPFRVFIDYSDPNGFTRRDTVQFFIGTPTVVFVDSASGGTGNWTTGQGWGVTTNSHTPPNAFTDSPAGRYNASANNSLTLNSQLNLNGYQYAQLRFWTKWAVEPSWDFATVELSTNNGSTWTTLRTKLSHSGSGRSGGQQPTGTWGYESYTPGDAWVEQDVDLSAFVNRQVRLRFRLAADGAEQRDGFYVDDIRVYGYTAVPAPATPLLLSPPNAASNQPTTISLLWSAAAGAETYRVQVSSDSLFGTVVLDDSTLTDTTRQVYDLTVVTRYFWRTRAKNIGGASPWSQAWRFTTTSQLTQQYLVFGGWNLVSVPLTVPDFRKDTLYPTSISPAFAFELGAGYIQKDTLANSLGYWLKFPGAQNVSMTGDVRMVDTIDVVDGWNLIGSISFTVDTASITTIPAGIRESDWFTFSGNYSRPSQLVPGTGYWVKATANGKFVLSSTATRLEAPPLGTKLSRGQRGESNRLEK